MMRWNNGLRSVFGPSGDSAAQPSRPEPKTVGKSSCASFAPKRGEEVEYLVMDVMGALVRLIDLVDHHDRPEAELQRLAEHEFGLRHRPFGGIDQDHDAVHHAEDPLHLAAEIGMAGRIDDVDPGIVPANRGAFREYRDTALALQIIGIEGALGHLLVGAEGAALAQQPVDERGFAVVDMGNYRNVAQIHGAGVYFHMKGNCLAAGI